MTEKSVHEENEKMLMETGRMAARLIHDFKNQLGGMKLYASYLKKRFADQPEGVEVAEKIIQGLNEMAEQASLVSKLTRPIEVRRERGDLGQFLDMLASSLKPQAAARQATIALDLAPGLPAARFDLQQMQVALGALVMRALDASPTGGEIRLGLRAEGDAFLVVIADAGETLEPERLSALFDFLTHERINRTSLGLALARRIIELHDGEITAVPGTPTGTRVEIRLTI